MTRTRLPAGRAGLERRPHVSFLYRAPRSRRGTVRSAGHAPDAGGARSVPARTHGQGPLLVFPSYYRRERPELVGHPAVLVSYRFNGFLDDIYATLVVQLHHAAIPARSALALRRRLQDAHRETTGREADPPGGRCGRVGGVFRSHDRWKKRSSSANTSTNTCCKKPRVVRLRHYVCPHCGTPVGNREVAMKRLEAWLEKTRGTGTTSLLKGWRGKSQKPTIICVECEKRVPLWDEMEEYFASPETAAGARTGGAIRPCWTTRARSVRWSAR